MKKKKKLIKTTKIKKKKMITFVSYASVDPVVISEELINTAINEQVDPSIAEIARKEGIDPEEVSSIRLDYKSKKK